MKKKILLLMVLALPFVVLADDCGVKVPAWSDFAPSLYVEVKEPTKWNKLNVIGNYWYNRKVEFDKQLEECTAISANEERFACYEELKIKQFKENTDYNARIEAKQINNSAIPEMNNKTDSMIPINSYINHFTRFQHNEIQ